MSTFFNELLPPKARKISYIVYALIGVTLGSFQAGFAAADIGSPLWLIISFAVFTYVGTAFGIVAASNTTTPTVTASGIEPLEEDESDVDPVSHGAG